MLCYSIEVMLQLVYYLLFSIQIPLLQSLKHLIKTLKTIDFLVKFKKYIFQLFPVDTGLYVLFNKGI